MELLVNAGQLYCVEYVPGPCTHRPSHHSSGLYPKTHTRILAIGRVEGVIHEKGEVVTRQVYENVRLDHLLSKELSYPQLDMTNRSVQESNSKKMELSMFMEWIHFLIPRFRRISLSQKQKAINSTLKTK